MFLIGPFLTVATDSPLIASHGFGGHCHPLLMACVLCLSNLIQLQAFCSKNMSLTTSSCGNTARPKDHRCAGEKCFASYSSFFSSITVPLCLKTIYLNDEQSWNKSPLCLLWLSLCPLQDGFNLLNLLSPRGLTYKHSPPPLTHALVTLDGQQGVNPLLSQTPATVKSGVTQMPGWQGKYTVYPFALTKRMDKVVQRFVLMCQALLGLKD